MCSGIKKQYGLHLSLSTGSSLRRPSQDNLLSLRRSVSGTKTHRVDLGGSDSYEIKVYEIDNVNGVQKRGGAGNKVRFKMCQ